MGNLPFFLEVFSEFMDERQKPDEESFEYQMTVFKKGETTKAPEGGGWRMAQKPSLNSYEGHMTVVWVRKKSAPVLKAV